MDDADKTPETDHLLHSAQRAIEAIGGIVEAKEDVVPIATNAGSLRSVATVIDGLSEEVRRCGGDNCMGRAIDGMKLWVTQDRLTQALARADAATARVMMLEDALRRIAEAETASIGGYAMLRDWEAVVANHRQIAQAALSSAIELARA